MRETSSGQGNGRQASHPYPLHSAFRHLDTYPFVHLAREKERALAKGLRVIDMGMGDPNEKTPSFLRETLFESVPERMGYPPAAGLPPLREAIAGWIRRRYGVALDPGSQVLPTNGSKEALYLVHQALLDPGGPRKRILIPEPAYPVYRIATLFAGGVPTEVPLTRDDGFLPRWDKIPESVWHETAALWINTPHNPTGSVAELDFLRRTAEIAHKHGVWVLSDEPYSEIYFDDPPPGFLQVTTEGVLVFNTLSKRSAMTGYRSGFIAGDRRLVASLGRVRPSQGVATPIFIQKVAETAWGDDSHVEEQRMLYARKRDVLLPALDKAGLDRFPAEATFYLWVRVPDGYASESFASRLAQRGLIVTPGSVFGDAGEGYVRMALVPTLAECVDAAALIAERPW